VESHRPGYFLEIFRRDAVLGTCAPLRNTAVDAAFRPDSRWQQRAALGFGFCGGISEAQRTAEKLSNKFPVDTIWNAVYLPGIEAASELQHDHPLKAIELLRSALFYEREYPPIIYLRGLAYLKAHDGINVAGEFQKILDHKGAYWILDTPGPYYPLSYLGLARAAALSSDNFKARRAYQDFFTLWKDADPDLQPLIQARKEYAALQ
jgi:hypothetical protein